MIQSQTELPNARKRRRRWIRRGFWLIAAVWFAWFAYVRIITPPAAALHAAANEIAPPEKALLELLDIVDRAPALSGSSSRASARYWYSWSDSPFLAGLIEAWSPAKEPNQKEAVRILDKARTGPLLDEIVACCRTNLDLLKQCRIARLSDDVGIEQGTRIEKLQEAAAALLFRARRRNEENQDALGALRDVRCALLLGRILDQRTSTTNSVYYYEYFRLSEPVQYELGRLANESALPLEVVRETIAEMNGVITCSIAEAIVEDMRLEDDIEALLDRYYTRDAHGDGWVVLATNWPDSAVFGLPPMGSRCRIWNLCAPLFHGRQTICEKMLRVRDRYTTFDSLTGDEMYKLIEAPEKTTQTSILDGPLQSWTSVIKLDRFQYVYSRTAQQRALTVMLSLSAYRQAYGDYPDTLEQLSPDLIEELPLDLCARKPFGYRKEYYLKYELGSEAPIPADSRHWRIPPEAYLPDSYVPRRKPAPE